MLQNTLKAITVLKLLNRNAERTCAGREKRSHARSMLERTGSGSVKLAVSFTLLLSKGRTSLTSHSLLHERSWRMNETTNSHCRTCSCSPWHERTRLPFSHLSHILLQEAHRILHADYRAIGAMVFVCKARIERREEYKLSPPKMTKHFFKFSNLE